MEEELECMCVALLFLLSYMSALCFWTDQWEKLMQNKEVFDKIVAHYKLLLLATKTKLYLSSSHSHVFFTVWTILVFRESIHCILRIECGEIWPWEIYSITVTFTALCAHGCLVLNYAAGNVIWPQHKQEASYRGLIFSKPKKEEEEKRFIRSSEFMDLLLFSHFECVYMPGSAVYFLLSSVFVCMCVWKWYVSEMLICIGGFIVLMKGHVS